MVQSVGSQTLEPVGSATHASVAKHAEVGPTVHGDTMAPGKQSVTLPLDEERTTHDFPPVHGCVGSQFARHVPSVVPCSTSAGSNPTQVVSPGQPAVALVSHHGSQAEWAAKPSIRQAVSGSHSVSSEQMPPLGPAGFPQNERISVELGCTRHDRPDGQESGSGVHGSVDGFVQKEEISVGQSRSSTTTIPHLPPCGQSASVLHGGKHRPSMHSSGPSEHGISSEHEAKVGTP
jgi:hypothetical protein